MSKLTALANWQPRAADDGGRATHVMRHEAVMEAASAVGAGAVLLSDRASLRWLGAGCARHLLLCGDRSFAIAAAGGSEPIGPVEPIDARESDGAAAALADALAQCGLGPRDPIAIELAQLPRPLVRMLGWDVCRDIGGALVSMRARKDDDELAAIARAAALVDAGQRALAACLRPGITELELWRAGQRALAAAVGDDVQTRIELTAGPRPPVPGAPPGHDVLQRGEPVLLSLACEREGYWAAATATVSCGPASAWLRDRHAALREALERGRDAARPGATAADVDRAMRERLVRVGLPVPRETGRAIGRSPHEAPVLRPGASTRLAAGTVLVLEPGIRAVEGGMRLGQTVVVDAGGARPLTAAPHDLT